MATFKFVDPKEFAELSRVMSEEDERREQLIKKSREVLKLSKNSIYSMHRREYERAAEQAQQAKEIAKRDLLPIVEQFPQLRFSASGAFEEWAEAIIFYEFVSRGRIPSMAELEIVTKEEYLGGVMDFTGELGRYAVLRATDRDLEGVKRCREVLDELFSQLQLFDWRNGNLRRKFDALKYGVKKVEQLIYELTLATVSAIVPKSGLEEPQPEAGGDGAEGEDGGAEEGGGGAPAAKRQRR